MTEKQENIIEAALELFAKEGYASTSTSKIAKVAGVSEGLIFRHFTNKEGLLAAIMQQGEDRLKGLFADIVMENEPNQVILKTLNIAKLVNSDPAQANFWKLQYKLKWELEHYDDKKMAPLRLALINAFEKLNYQDPEKEAETLLILIDGMAMRLFLDGSIDIGAMVKFLTNKYIE